MEGVVFELTVAIKVLVNNALWRVCWMIGEHGMLEFKSWLDFCWEGILGTFLLESAVAIKGYCLPCFLAGYVEQMESIVCWNWSLGL